MRLIVTIIHRVRVLLQFDWNLMHQCECECECDLAFGVAVACGGKWSCLF
jgi:hypothetical protein